MKLASLFFLALALSAQTIPWPAIGPDVTGGKGPGGHVYDIPSKQCYRRLTRDTSFDGPILTITSIQWTSNVVTIGVADTKVGKFTETAVITVSGVVPAGFNGTYALSNTSGNSTDIPIGATYLKYVLRMNPNPSGGPITSLGTVQYTPNILAFDARSCYASF